MKTRTRLGGPRQSVRVLSIAKGTGWGQPAVAHHSRRRRHQSNPFQLPCYLYLLAVTSTSLHFSRRSGIPPMNVPSALPGGRLPHNESLRGPPRKMPLTPRSEVTKYTDASKTGKHQSLPYSESFSAAAEHRVPSLAGTMPVHQSWTEKSRD